MADDRGRAAVAVVARRGLVIRLRCQLRRQPDRPLETTYDVECTVSSTASMSTVLAF